MKICTCQLVQITRGASVQSVLDVMEVDITKIGSPALARLIEEVRNDVDEFTRGVETTSSYVRFHNRHNRSGYNRFHNRHNRSR